MAEKAAFDVPKFFLFGDSHAGTLMQAAIALGLEFDGGSIMAGKYLNDDFFDVRDGRFAMTTKMGKQRMRTRLVDAGLRNFFDVNIPIISTVGFNTTNFSRQFSEEGWALADSSRGRMVSEACFQAMVEVSRKSALDFYRALADKKKCVFAVLSPQRFDRDDIAVCRAFEKFMMARVAALGATIIDVRAETTGSDGILLPQFARPDDPVHGNDAFGEAVLRKFAQMIASEQV